MKALQPTIRILFVLSILLWSCQSEAQRPKLRKASAEQIAEKQTTLQAEKLELEQEQAEKLKAINLKYAKQLKAEMETQQDNRKASIARLKKINEAQNEEVKAFLSEEQFRDYVELKKQNRARLRQYNNDNRAQAFEQRKRQMQALDLSETQKTELRAIKMKYAEKMKALKEQDNSLDSKKEFKSLMEEQDKEVKAILSEEQFETYLNIKAEKLKKRRANMKK